MHPNRSRIDGSEIYLLYSFDVLWNFSFFSLPPIALNLASLHMKLPNEKALHLFGRSPQSISPYHSSWPSAVTVAASSLCLCAKRIPFHILLFSLNLHLYRCVCISCFFLLVFSFDRCWYFIQFAYTVCGRFSFPSSFSYFLLSWVCMFFLLFFFYFFDFLFIDSRKQWDYCDYCDNVTRTIKCPFDKSSNSTENSRKILIKINSKLYFSCDTTKSILSLQGPTIVFVKGQRICC